MTSPTRPDDSALDLFGSLPEPARRPEPRRRRRGWIVGTVLAALLLSASAAYAGTAATASLPSASAVTMPPAPTSIAAPALAWPAYGAGAVGAVGVVGAEEEGLLARYGSDDPVPTGSIAKVATALVVLAAKPIAAGTDGDTITFTAADVGYYDETIAEDGSNAPVTAGLQLTERQALTAMMLPSANNYAKSLAVWSYGSEEAFLAASRTWLDSKGLTRTVLADTSGLSPATVSTTAEMVKLGELLLADPVLAPIVALPSADIPGVGVLQNTNTLLGRSGVDGIKTGTTDEAGACLLFSLDTMVEGQPTTLVGVVTGAPSHPQLATDVQALIPTVEAGFHSVELATAGQDLGVYTSAWGEKAIAETSEARSVLVWGAVSASTTVALNPATTLSDGQSVGSATVEINGTAYQLPLVAEGGIDDPGFGWRVSHPADLFR